MTDESTDYVKAAYTKMAQFVLRPELYYDQLGGDHEPIHLTRRQRFRMWRRDLPRPYISIHFGRPSNRYRWDHWDD
jgi:hypothetical protein